MLENIYTTKMSANKKTMENRFSKIRSSNTRIHKVMATLMTVVVIITMLCANVVMAMVDEKTSEQYIIEVKKAETILDYYNKPFVENNTVHFPLRETFEKFGIMENKDSYINWDNGKIEICIAWSDNSDYAKEAHSQLNNGNGVDVITLLHYYRIEIGKNVLTYNATKNLAGQDISSPKSMNSAPLLRNGITYVPFEYLKGFNVSRSFMELNFTIKDINGNDLYSIPYVPMKPVTFDTNENSSFDASDATSVLHTFLKALHKADYNTMTTLCTDTCINEHFKLLDTPEVASVYGIHKASTKSIGYGFTNKENDYSKDPIIVTLDCELPAYSSAIGGEQEIKVYFEKQADGTFLISDFTN